LVRNNNSKRFQIATVIKAQEKKSANKEIPKNFNPQSIRSDLHLHKQTEPSGSSSMHDIIFIYEIVKQASSICRANKQCARFGILA